MTIIGVDVGGTKIKAGFITAEGVVLESVTEPTGKVDVMGQIIQVIGALTNKSKEPISAIGVGTAGRVDAHSGKINGATSNLPFWAGTNVKDTLEKKFGVPVAVDNDANAAAIAEGAFGAARGIRDFVCITLGTGVGAGAVVNGQLLRGHAGGGGEIGHMILYPGGHLCNCGKKGCLEQYVSGTAIQRAITTEIAAASASFSPRRLFRLAQDGHPAAKKITGRFCDDLVQGILNVHAVLDPEMIVLGGGVVESSDYWWDPFMERLGSIPEITFKLNRAHFQNDAGMIGAAALALGYAPVS
ncbi:ROK family protein [Bacillus sp. REN3]|uniref:ROK family protein n=1 Tax=Bacillus sp. REN3 TaxID=2802440 RepID=UPI001AEF336C|nr:ROK family protein [Bacillus sp. REN3]